MVTVLVLIVPTWMFLSSGAATSATIATCYLLVLAGVVRQLGLNSTQAGLRWLIGLILVVVLSAIAASLQPMKSAAAVGNSILCVAPLLFLTTRKNVGGWLPASTMAWLPLGLGLSVLFLIVEAYTQLAVTRLVFPNVPPTAMSDYTSFARGFAFLTALSWPVAMVLVRRRGPLAAVGLLALCGAAVLLGDPEAVKLALLTGILVFLITAWAPAIARVAIMILPIAAVLAAPVVPFALFPYRTDVQAWFGSSAVARIEYWHFLVERWLERPIFGWGPQMASRMPFRDADSELYGTMTGAPPYPHNVFIEVWAELGLVGAAVLCCIALVLAVHLRRLPDRDLPWAVATLCTSLSISLISFSLWSDFMALLVFLPLIVFRLGRTER